MRTPFGIIYQRIPSEGVDYPTNRPAGTIVVETGKRRLYYVLGNGKAISYGIAVGMEGSDWSGVSTISAKREWPDWTPTPNILKRFPDLPRHMDGGPDNPLGARALYLGATLYRIHGTNEPWKLGGGVSSGCIRLSNEDVIDLYNRAKIGATVVVQR
ncbi:MAG: L,D-transpeptidase [Deltaproteobacteria bacterium]|nr:L,D-transpeptidase [Deltaproteobacteria bacterium]